MTAGSIPACFMACTIDGQQRLTTLTLLLIHLHNLQKGREDAVHDIEKMIFSQKYGRKSFNIDVEERLACMEAIFENQPFDDTDSPESVQNIPARYEEIKDSLLPELTGDAQNILARTLCVETYDRNPGLKQFIERTGIQLRPHAEFKKADLETRQALYLELAKRVWNPALIRAELEVSQTETVGR